MFNQSVITSQGLELDAKIRAGSTTAIFTKVELGDGTYAGTENLEEAQQLKNKRQAFKISSISLSGEKTVRIRVVASNAGVTSGYYITEIGVYAQDQDAGEILYGVATGTAGNMDYQPSEEELPNSTGLFEYYIAVSNAGAATIQLGNGVVAAAEDLLEKVDIKGGDISDTIIGTLEESTEVFPVPTAVESAKTFFGKIRKFIQDFNDFKVGILTVGMIVNNAVTNNSGLPVSAAVAKGLQEQITSLNSDLAERQNIVIKTVIVDPGGYNYADIPAAGISSAWVPIAFNGDYNAWSGYVLGVNAINGNTLRVWLSAQRSGSTRINYCYLQIS